MKKRKVTIFIATRSNFGERDAEIFRELGYNVIVCSSKSLFYPSEIFRYLRGISKWFEWYKKLKSVDIFFAWWAISFDIVLLSKIFRKPCIIVAAGAEIERGELPREYPCYENKSIFKKAITNLTLKFADKVISVSKYAKDSADKIVRNPTNEVVYNSVDINIFKPIRIEKKPYITTVCWISKLRLNKKGLLPLLEAFSRIINKYPEYFLIYVGDEIESIGGKEIIKRRAEELGILDKVIFMNFFKTAKDYVKFLNQCKIYVQYSWNETFGVAMCEAMACGIPVIASNRTALPEILGDAGLIADRGSIEKGNIDDLVEKIEMLITDDHLCEKLSKKGIERVKNNFSKELRKQKLKKIVESMLNK
ncbi:MAG: glycosyltransferase family 4 protein [Candidatus Altiarchaeota archaeon]